MAIFLFPSRFFSIHKGNCCKRFWKTCKNRVRHQRPAQNPHGLNCEEKWSGRLDLNQRPHPPQGCAIPGFATSRPNYGEVGFTALSGYHLRSRSVKKARRVSRRSSNIFRLKSCAAPSAAAPVLEPPPPLVAPELSPSPFCSRKCLRAPAIVNPSSYSSRLIRSTISTSSCRYSRCPLGLFTFSSIGNSV